MRTRFVNYHVHRTTPSCPIVRGAFAVSDSVKYLQEEANEKIAAAMPAPVALLAPTLTCITISIMLNTDCMKGCRPFHNSVNTMGTRDLHRVGDPFTSH